MTYDDIENFFHRIGRHLVREKEHVTVELLGSAALVLGYKCWPNANDIDARWKPEDSFFLGPIIEDIGNKSNHPKGRHWMNMDIADIVVADGTWSAVRSYGFLHVRIPTPEFMMSLLIHSLYTCKADSEKYPPYGKSAAQCLALARSQGWGQSEIEQRVAPFFPRGIQPVCFEWLERIFITDTSPNQRSERVEDSENYGNLKE